MAKYMEGRASIRERENRTIRNATEAGQHIYNRKLIKQVISDSTTVKFRRIGSFIVGLSSDALLPDQATMFGKWGPPSMMYPPWARWYGPWILAMMHFHP
jgi:hypothetical protein